MAKWLHLAIGSLAGGIARYMIAGSVYRVFGSNFPHGTLAVNLTGCFLIGFLTVLAEDKFILGPNARIFLMVGFCGAFTTFSTFMLETSNLMKDGEMLSAFLNILISILFGFMLFRLGIILGKII